MSERVRIEGELAVIDFDRFDLDSYALFLACKAMPESRVSYAWQRDCYTLTMPARFAARLGQGPAVKAAAEPLALAPHLFDYQRWALRLALEAKRYALWLDTGLGKTAVYLDWARLVQQATGGRVLILAPLAVLPQIAAECGRFYPNGEIATRTLRSREALIDFCQHGESWIVGLCNYEKFIPGEIPELRFLAGLVADECFTSGTMVDTPAGPRAIETIRAGDRVLNATGIDTVVATKRRAVDGFVAVHVDNGQSIINSENHPYFTRRGWVRAADLREGDELVTQSEAVRILRDGVRSEDRADPVLQPGLCRQVAGGSAGLARSGQSVDNHGHESAAPLYVVWPGDDPSEFHYAVLQPVVRAEVADGAAGSAGAHCGATAGVAAETGASDSCLPGVWIDLRRRVKESDATVLQSALLSELAYAPTGDQSEGSRPRSCGETGQGEERVVRGGITGSVGGKGATGLTQSHEQPREPREAERHAAGNGTPAAVAGRQGAGHHKTAAHALGSVGRWLGLRVRGASAPASVGVADHGLPRSRATDGETGGGSGREHAPDGDWQGSRQPQDCLSRIARVDRIEILERDNPRLAADRGSDNSVELYDLQVANHPSFSVHGFLVHNSSILKTGGGTIKWNLIKSARGIEYKLSCTATPAPNDAMEYASQAAFLEKLRTEGEILWTFFHKGKNGEWSVKPHAREAFYRFMASWSLYLRDPATFGFADILASLPAPEIIEERIAITEEQQVAMTAVLAEHNAGMFADQLGITARTKLAQIARGFVYQGKNGTRRTARIPSRKVARVAELISREVAAGRQVLVWTTFDEEAAVIREALREFSQPEPSDEWCTTLAGSQSEPERAYSLEAFRQGEIACLISKPALIGYGLNLQFVQSMIFSGFDDSFERTYQAIRRAYRFGQTETVRVFFPYVPELEGLIFENIRQKEARFLSEVAAQEALYRVALASALEGVAA